ncbi:hypothetical protein B9Q05_11320 [Candidatus Marsarchaeota G2 archaeon ECH_B_1]|uniref:Aspartyl protease n=1 Tax=Candidatus Marsarchaeota G2 archaeon ECH_B_1 TaxID=1978159 RepID=A0A2R6BMB9_9ARCH|nr:MAG: hypothetical protein B9Q05_11320 [Candidatus Marsarchaeota G2 archaeon ECH_B_1]
MAQKWKYDETFTPPAAVVKAKLCGQSVNLLVDTGFSGGVLIPFWMFERMSLLSYLTPDEYYAVMADTRKIRLYTATGVLTLRSKKHTVNTHSSPYIDKKIVGRDFLKRFLLTLNGPKSELIVSYPTTNHEAP